MCDGLENMQLEKSELASDMNSHFSMKDSVGSKSIGSLSNFISTREKGEGEDGRSISSGSKSKAKKKKKTPKINSICSIAPLNSSEFQFVKPDYIFPAIKNPTTFRSPVQNKQSKIRRDLLKKAFLNLGIDEDSESGDEK